MPDENDLPTPEADSKSVRVPERPPTIIGFVLALLFIIAVVGCVNRNPTQTTSKATEAEPPSAESWYFAVSGDSRDCGDLIMPKIARSIADNSRQSKVRFYWHLGDLRALYRIDCDMAKRANPAVECARGGNTLNIPPTNEYLTAAWPDFILNEVRPFERLGIPVFLGIGNHELIKRSRADFRDAFKEWLTQTELTEQRKRDQEKKIVSMEGDTYFHFVKNGVDFIYLDNADSSVGFSLEQLSWLERILKSDVDDEKIQTIIVGMHEALPYSKSRNHAMDESCSSLCSGSRAYNLLVETQKKKHVYVLASHSHLFESDIFKDQPELRGKELKGWIIGTAGAEQYRNEGEEISYGYLLVEVKPDGTIRESYVSVGRDSPPVDSADWATKLADYCFAENRKPKPTEKSQTCNCTQ